MTSERDQSHATSPRDAAADLDHVEAGRVSRSALLRKPDHAIASGLVQRQARDGNGVADGAEAAVAAASASSGAPLPGALMRKFEQSLGADLGGVRVHTGGASEAANDAVGAKAYTVGQDIHFGAGHYDPSSPAGEHLLAHEVAHTVQQAGGTQRRQYQLAVSSPGDHLEHEADRAADAMIEGAPATIAGASPSTSRMAFREAAAKDGPPATKFIQRTIPLGEVSLGERKVSFLKCSLKATGELKGSIAAKEGESGVKVDTLLKPNLLGLGTSLEFDPNGWFGIKELTAASIGVGKGTLGKVTLFKGMAFVTSAKGKQQVGEVTLSVSALSWDEKKLSAQLLPLEVGGELIWMTFDAQTDIGGGHVVAAGAKIVGGIKGTVGIDVAQAAQLAGGKLAATVGLEAALGAFGVGALVGATGAAALGGLLELTDEVDGDNIAVDTVAEVDRLSLGFEREMTAPGHQWKPSPLFNKDPYLRGIEMASEIKRDFFKRFLADPRVEAWKAAHPDQGQQMQQLARVYETWVKQDDGARTVISMHAAKVKSQTKQATYAERFLAYAQRFRLSGGARVVKLFDRLWPASWMDGARTMPMFFNQGVPKACYAVVSELAPASYPADLKRWVNPPTLL